MTGDEEGPAVNGTVKLLDWAQRRGERFDHCLLGEPTSRTQVGDTIKNGRRGSLTGRLTIAGRQGHVAYPQLADNPLRRLGPILEALQTPPLDNGTADFDPSNLEIVSVDVGNPATNVIPGEARLVFNVRFNDRWTPATLAAEIEARVAAAAPGANVALTFDPTNAIAFLTPPGPFTDLVARAIEETTGAAPTLSTSGGTSDARFIKDACPVVEVGLVGATMHAVDERVAVGGYRGAGAGLRADVGAVFRAARRRTDRDKDGVRRHRRRPESAGRIFGIAVPHAPLVRSAASAARLNDEGPPHDFAPSPRPSTRPLRGRLRMRAV